MPVVTWVTPGTVDVRMSSDVVVYTKWLLNANIDFESGLWLTPQMINKLFENGKNNIVFINSVSSLWILIRFLITATLKWKIW